MELKKILVFSSESGIPINASLYSRKHSTNNENQNNIKMPSEFQRIKLDSSSHILIILNLFLIIGFIFFIILMVLMDRKKKVKKPERLSVESSNSSSQSTSSSVSQSVQKIASVKSTKKIKEPQPGDCSKLKFYKSLEEKYKLPNNVAEEIDKKLKIGDF